MSRLSHIRQRVSSMKHTMRIRLRNRPKVFVVGTNKTGTTSLDAYFKSCGYLSSPQSVFEALADDYRAGNWGRITRAIRRYETFQDNAFAHATDEFLVHLKREFPRSKFILTVRDSEEQWYYSLVRFHSKLFFNGETNITWEDVKPLDYIRPGSLYDLMLSIVGTEQVPPYDYEALTRFYREHNDRVRRHFVGDDRLLEINLADADAQAQLAAFLNTDPTISVPRLNTSA